MKKIPEAGLVRILPFFLFPFFIACTHDPKLIDELPEVCYTTEIAPILQSSCGISGCHATPGHETSFGANSYNSVMTIVEAGDAKASKLYKVITSENSFEMMPPDHPLTKEQRNTIYVWIEQGALDADCTTDTVSDNNNNANNGNTALDSVCFTQVIQPLLESRCATADCHDVTSAREGIVLASYSSILNSEEAVVPYSPGESKIYGVLFETGEDIMPPAPLAPLSNEEKEDIRKWIADGALNSDCPEAICDTTNAISFANDVFPVIENTCVGCHNASAANGGVNLSTYTNIEEVANTTLNAKSWLSGVINKDPGFVPMPPSGTLSFCDIRKIELWISQGTINN